jgi:hypothetical protein
LGTYICTICDKKARLIDFRKKEKKSRFVFVSKLVHFQTKRKKVDESQKITEEEERKLFFGIRILCISRNINKDSSFLQGCQMLLSKHTKPNQNTYRYQMTEWPQNISNDR